jgi:hypothetical protein
VTVCRPVEAVRRRPLRGLGLSPYFLDLATGTDNFVGNPKKRFVCVSVGPAPIFCTGHHPISFC